MPDNGAGIEAKFAEQLARVANELRPAIEAAQTMPAPVQQALYSWVSNFVRQVEHRASLDLLGQQSLIEGRRASAPDQNVYGRAGQYQFPASLYQAIVYPTDKISWATYWQMTRDDPQVDLCLSLLKGPVKSSDWTWDCADAEIARWATEALLRVWDNFCDSALFALDYGWIPVEVVYAPDSSGLVSIASFNELDPTYVWVRQDWQGKAVGLYQLYSGETIEIPPGKFFVYSYRQRHGWVYGVSRLRSAYPFWYAKRFVVQFANLYAERFALPWFKVFYPSYPIPTGVDSSGNPTYSDPSVIAMDRANAIRGQSAVALPTLIGASGVREFDIEIMQQGQGRTHPYADLLDFYDSQISKGILIPGLTAEIPEKGSQALGKVQSNRLSDTINSITEDLKSILDPIFNRLRVWNFGQDSPPLTWNPEPVNDALAERLWAIAQHLIEGGKFGWLEETGEEKEVDLSEIAKKLGIATRVKPQPPSALVPPGSLPVQPAEIGPLLPGDQEPEGAPEFAFERGEFRRELTRHEKREGMVTLGTMFDAGDEGLRTVVSELIAAQAADLTNQVTTAWQKDKAGRIKAADGLAIRYQSRLADEITERLSVLAQKADEALQQHFSVKPLARKEAILAWAKSKGATLARDETREMLAAAQSQALSAAVQERSAQDASYSTATFAKWAADDWAAGAIPIAVAQAVNLGVAEGIAQDDRVRFAQWSAILDARVCALCLWRDGQIIDVANPDYRRWTPPIHFGYCRCIWVPILEDVEPTWKEIVPAGLMKLFQLERSRES